MTEWLLHFTRSHIISLSSFTSFLYLPWLRMSVAPKCQSFVANRSLLPQNFLNDKQKCEKSSMTHIKFLCMLSHVGLFVTPWTVAHQAPLSMGFFSQEYWNELPFPLLGDLPNPGIEPAFPASPLIFSTVIYLSYDWESRSCIVLHSIKGPWGSRWQFQVQHFSVTVPFWLSHLFDWSVHSVGIFLVTVHVPRDPGAAWITLHELRVIGPMTGLWASRAEAWGSADSSPTEVQWMSSFIFSGCFFVNSTHLSLEFLIKMLSAKQFDVWVKTLFVRHFSSWSSWSRKFFYAWEHFYCCFPCECKVGADRMC